MTEGANVQSIEAITDLRTALLRFGDEARQTLTAAEQELQRTEDWLRERLNYWHREVERLEEIARQAYRAYEACRANLICDSEGRCYAPPCTREHAYYEEAVKFMRQAQAELQNAQSWAQRVKQAVGEYQTLARRLSALAGDGISQSAAHLSNVADRLYEYTSTSAPNANATISQAPSGETVSSLDALGDLIGGLAAAPLVATLAGLGVSTENANPLPSVSAAPPISHSADELQQRVHDLEAEQLPREQAQIEEIRRQRANPPLPDPRPLSSPPTPPADWTPHGAGNIEGEPTAVEGGAEIRHLR